jgi:hypothetical protein
MRFFTMSPMLTSLATVTVLNYSSVPVTVDNVEWASEEVWGSFAEMSTGREFPHRLEGHSSASWHLKHVGKEVVFPPVVIAAQRPLKVEVAVEKIGRKRITS